MDPNGQIYFDEKVKAEDRQRLEEAELEAIRKMVQEKEQRLFEEELNRQLPPGWTSRSNHGIDS